MGNSSNRLDAVRNDKARGDAVNDAVGWLDVLLPVLEVTGDAAARRCGWQTDAVGVYCHRCGATVGEGEATENGCGHCRGDTLAWDEVHRLGGYREPLAQWIVRMKFHRMWTWGGWFGKRLAEVIPEVISSEVTGDKERIVVPIPLHWSRRMRRGYDQTLLIAEAFARTKGYRLRKVIRRRRATAQQSGIGSVVKRMENVRGAFVLRWNADVRGQHVWLIDDVKTTGATAGQCTRLLKKAGAASVGLVVVAVVNPHGEKEEN